MKIIFTFVTFLLIFFNFNNIAFSIEADVFVQSTVNRAAKTLGGGLTKEERIEKLKEINMNATKVKILFIFLIYLLSVYFFPITIIHCFRGRI